MTTKRLAAWSGVVGVVVGLTTTFAATLLSPTFSWTANALSELGAADAANPWLFNYGLIGSGIVALPFAAAVWLAARNGFQRLGAVTFGLHLVSLVLVGVFPVPAALHTPAALAYFTFLVFTLWIHGTGSVLAGATRRGLATIWFGIANVLAWILWVGFGPGSAAVPEIVGSLLMAVWVVVTVRSFAFTEWGTTEAPLASDVERPGR